MITAQEIEKLDQEIRSQKDLIERVRREQEALQGEQGEESTAAVGDNKPAVYLENGSLYVQMPNGNYKIYDYDPNWFNGRDPTKMGPREVFDELYGEDSRYNPYSEDYRWGSNNDSDNSSIQTADDLYQTIITTTTTTTTWGGMMTTTGTIPQPQIIEYEDEDGNKYTFIYTGEDFLRDIGDWKDIGEGVSAYVGGVKVVKWNDGRISIRGKEGVSRDIYKLLSGKRGRIYLAKNVDDLISPSGAAKGSLKSSVKWVAIPIGIDFYNYYVDDKYNNTLDFQADLGTDVTIFSISSLASAAATYITTALISGGTGAASGSTIMPGYGTIAGGVVGIITGLGVDTYFGEPLRAFWRGIITGANNFINGVRSSIDSLVYYIMEKFGQIEEA
jgi:hypothetical protein